MCFSCGNGNANDECDFVHDLGCVMVRCIRKAPPKKNRCIFGHCPNCDLTPPIAQIRALCGTNSSNSNFDYGNEYFDSD